MIAAQRLITLATVQEHGGVVAAAAALHVTPSAVSQQLRALEREAGVPLLDRSGRQIGLTQAGERLAERGWRILAEVVRAGDDLAPWTDASTRTLVVAAFQTAICQLIAPVLQQGRLAEDGLTLRVVELEGPPAIRDLHAGLVDVVLREERLLPADTTPAFDPRADPQTRLVVDDRFRVVVPAGWALEESEPGDLRVQLVSRPWVVQSAGTAGGDMMAELEARWRFSAQVAHTCVEYSSAVALVGAGAGATLAPHLALPLPEPTGVPSTAAPDALHVLEGTPDLGMRRIRALCRPARRPSTAVERLLELVAEQANAIGLDARRPSDRWPD